MTLQLIIALILFIVVIVVAYLLIEHSRRNP